VGAGFVEGDLAESSPHPAIKPKQPHNTNTLNNFLTALLPFFLMLKTKMAKSSLLAITC
jgi:hypothetical protein